MRRRPPRSTPLYSSAASDVYKRQASGHRRRAVSLPRPEAVSQDLQLIGLAPERSLQVADALAQLDELGPLLLARQALRAALQQLLAPRIEQVLGDLMLAA